MRDESWKTNTVSRCESIIQTEHLGATQLGTTAPLSNNAKITSTSSDYFDEGGFDEF